MSIVYCWRAGGVYIEGMDNANRLAIAIRIAARTAAAFERLDGPVTRRSMEAAQRELELARHEAGVPCPSR